MDTESTEYKTLVEPVSKLLDALASACFVTAGFKASAYPERGPADPTTALRAVETLGSYLGCLADDVRTSDIRHHAHTMSGLIGNLCRDLRLPDDARVPFDTLVFHMLASRGLAATPPTAGEALARRAPRRDHDGGADRGGAPRGAGQPATSDAERIAAPLVCSTCNDTHRITLGDREVPCTRCPVPCETCRSRPAGAGPGAYCAGTPCGCPCHRAGAGVKMLRAPRFDEEQRAVMAAEALRQFLAAAREHDSKLVTDALSEIRWLHRLVVSPGEAHDVCDANMVIHGIITDRAFCARLGVIAYDDTDGEGVDGDPVHAADFNGVFDAVAGAAEVRLGEIRDLAL